MYVRENRTQRVPVKDVAHLQYCVEDDVNNSKGVQYYMTPSSSLPPPPCSNNSIIDLSPETDGILFKKPSNNIPKIILMIDDPVIDTPSSLGSF